jgi:hypothetical protein
MPETRFPLGQCVITPGARDTLHPEDVPAALRRHGRGDWGDVGVTDRMTNETALAEDARLFSVYHDRNKVTFWIITEADRSVTTVLLPGEY